ncbi:MAG: hypothetical protein IK066_05580 [Kiritimatiellae bacterium]|nr:hypothetical protein [Kiritimatiellia bacterium]
MLAVSCRAWGAGASVEAGASAGIAAEGASSGAVQPADLLAVPAAEVLPALHRLYAPVSNLTCSVRRTTSGAVRHNATLISNVAFARDDRLNVETVSPVARRFVIDGANLHARRPDSSAVEVTPIDKLTPSLLSNLRSVPASPEELLAAVDPSTAADLSPEAPAARQISYGPLVPDAPARLTVLSLDESGLVLSIVSYASADRSTPLVATTFSSPVHPLPGVPLYTRQETRTSDAAGVSLRTVSHFDSIRVNIALPDALFDPAAYF